MSQKYYKFTVGFCFALFHGSPEQTVYQFIVGCAFAFLAIKSGSILPSILMHFVNNGLLVIFAACNLFDAEGNLIISQTANIVLIVLAVVALIGGLVWLFIDKKLFAFGDFFHFHFCKTRKPFQIFIHCRAVKFFLDFQTFIFGYDVSAPAYAGDIGGAVVPQFYD